MQPVVICQKLSSFEARLKLARTMGLISAAHFLVTVFVFAGGMWFVAEAARSGASEIPEIGTALIRLAQVLSEPTRSLVMGDLPRDTFWFWPALIANSVAWGCGLGVMWTMIRKRSGRSVE